VDNVCWRFYDTAVIICAPFYTNDYLSPSQMIPASDTHVLVNGSAKRLGSDLRQRLGSEHGPRAFFLLILTPLELAAVFALRHVIQLQGLFLKNWMMN
jgi:hypothetical protein